MPTQHSINLISPHVVVSPHLVEIAQHLRRISLVVIGVFFVGGVTVATTYLVLKQRYGRLVVRRDALARQVAGESVKEGALLAVKKRVELIGKLRAVQGNWSAIVQRVSEIAPSPFLRSLAVDEQRKVVLTVQTPTVEQLFPILTSLVGDVESKKILSPQIVSFQMDETGKAQMTIAFFPSR